MFLFFATLAVAIIYREEIDARTSALYDKVAGVPQDPRQATIWEGETLSSQCRQGVREQVRRMNWRNPQFWDLHQILTFDWQYV
jgi:hypothetical protein